MKTKNKRNYLKQSGITLIALVVTIVVLLILAGVTINALFGDIGIINRAKDAQNKMDQAAENDLKAINGFNEWMEETADPHPSDKIKVKETGKKIGRDFQANTVIAEDKNGNQVVVPGGFKISGDSGESVEKGIVIEDKDENQFVWVPVSNINGDGSNKIKKDDGSEVEITLGRYTFDSNYNSTTSKWDGTGEPTILQRGSEYDQTTLAQAIAGTLDTKYGAKGVSSYYYELSDSRTSNEKDDTTGTNTTAKNLKEFIEKTEENRGFYIARYEASYGSGYNAEGTDTATKFGNAKPLSKPSTANSRNSMDYTTGTLWNYITQPQAALVSQNMYKNDSYVESDLINSYAWDTAIVYIQEMGNTNYANQTNVNKTLKNTGSTGDEKCKIFDMIGNTTELSTEYCTLVRFNSNYSCTSRGGYYLSYGACTSYRNNFPATYNNNMFSFRPLIYVK